MDPDEIFIADAVTHSYNYSKSNWRKERYANQVCELGMAMEASMPPPYRRTRDSYLSDWDVEDTTNVLFRESYTDFAVFHPQTITIFDDGLTSLEKAREFLKRNPKRAAGFASVDLFGMDDPFEELTRQVEEFEPHGVKVYPSYWEDDGHKSFKMDDPEMAFPLWEHVQNLGLDVVAVHKAVPFGPAPMEPYKVGDVDEAAANFPDLNFEIVHGGMAFAEETGWQIARHPNVYVNLEITAIECALSSKSFVDIMEKLLYPGGKSALNKILYGSGAPHFHPQLLIDSLWEFDFPEMEWIGGSYEITQKDKRKILGENLFEAHKLDKDEIRQDISNDEFSKRSEIAEPYSTTNFEVDGD